jgi:hypothetical protein
MIVPQLANPAAAKLLTQDVILHDALECRGSAAARMVHLAEEMIRCGRQARAKNETLQMPARILPTASDGPLPNEELFDPAALYPDSVRNFDWDRAALQVEIGHLHQLIRKQDREIADLRKRAESLSERLTRRLRMAFGRIGP